MTRTELVNKVSREVHKVGFQLKKHSPEILVIGGVVGTVTAAVMACRATTKVNAILEEAKQNIEGAREVLEQPDLAQKYVDKHGEAYTEENFKKDITIYYTHAGVQFAKIYAPAVTLGVLSVTSILAGHNMLRKRNLALAAAYTAVDSGFKEYRSRVVERFGEALDKELKYNIKTKEVQETVVNEDGTESTVTKTIEVADLSGPSEYAMFFDEYCTGWTKDPEQNRRFLQLQEKYANQKLQTQGYLFLNDVYEMLGMQKTKAGHVVGWIYDLEHPVGDNRVDFGIFDLYDEQKRDFVNGRERSILLDFNVDGNIWEKM